MSMFVNGCCLVDGCNKDHDYKALSEVGDEKCPRGDQCRKATKIMDGDISACPFYHEGRDDEKHRRARNWELWMNGELSYLEIFNTNPINI